MIIEELEEKNYFWPYEFQVMSLYHSVSVMGLRFNLENRIIVYSVDIRMGQTVICWLKMLIFLFMNVVGIKKEKVVGDMFTLN